MQLVDKFVRNRIEGKTEKKTKKTFALVFFGPLVTTFILYILLVTKVDLNAHNWLHWTIVLVMVPAIYYSLFITQKLDLIGNYGESILLLIPTFVWLLPASTVALNFMVSTSFLLILMALVLLFLGVMAKVILPNGKKELLQKVMPMFIRISFTLVSVVSTIIVSIILINWARYSMKWDMLFDSVTEEFTRGNYTAPAWITFIAVVTLFTALGLVSLGLIDSFQESFRREYSAGARESFKRFVSEHRKNKGIVEKKFIRKKNVVIDDDLTNSIKIKPTRKKKAGN